MRRLWFVRLAALWVLAGAVLKLTHGSPADLPHALLDLPLEQAAIFRLVLAIEFAVGIFALLYPKRGWLPLLILLVTFAGVLIAQLVAGEASCGCFGTAVTMPPALMLGIDLTLLGLLIMSRPWAARELEDEHRPTPLPWIACILALGAAGLPWLLDRTIDAGEALRPGGTVTMHHEAWLGKKLDDPEIALWVPEAGRIENGVIVVWSATCGLCAEHLMDLEGEMRGMDDREVVLLELPSTVDEDHPREVDIMPDAKEWFVHHVKLPDEVRWWITPPVHFEVQGGTVVIALDADEL